MKNVVLLCYGKEVEFKRTLFAVLSFWSWYDNSKNDVRVILYTDNPNYFKPYLLDFEVVYVHVPLSEIQESTKKSGLIYRFKISVIDKTYTLYPQDDVLYIDTDTFFTSNPRKLLDALVPGQSFMHLREQTFEEMVGVYKWLNTEKLDAQEFPRSFLRLIESKTFSVDKREEQFNRFQYVWNAGVIGLPNNMKNVIPDVFALSDEFYLKTQWRISEQLAFTVVLNSVSKIQASGDVINHYWHYKDRVDYRLNELFEPGFKKLNQKRKLIAVKALTQKLDKLIYHEQMLTNTKVYLREKDYLNGVKYAYKALKGIPLNDDFVKILKYRFSKAAF
ncbi:hypothetical protein ACFSC6_05655 [Rufibacter sediminis]|uniref:Glycosyl transferase n=1 Tax=Rufibacter sediminis TaxID=2762756 RepID=A0ABR6VQG5_9BACT|nr:hypothetical protein [Rufibacter sediminis]MBC3539175.1 hypothetical protein [Rufibacter sediminis]